MKKVQIALVVGVILAAFAGADYYLNNLGKEVGVEPQGKVPETNAPSSVTAPFLSAFKVGDTLEGFQVQSQVAANQVFDKIDLSPVKNIQIVKNQLVGIALPARLQAPAAATTPPVPPVSEPLTIYEIRGPKNQGGLTYLAVKLQFVAQINATTETLNEDSRFGDNSFFYNDLNLQSTAFLVVQIKENLYAFQYSRKNPETYTAIQKIIQQLTAK